jgi:hypothetical protein
MVLSAGVNSHVPQAPWSAHCSSQALALTLQGRLASHSLRGPRQPLPRRRSAQPPAVASSRPRTGGARSPRQMASCATPSSYLRRCAGPATGQMPSNAIPTAENAHDSHPMCLPSQRHTGLSHDARVVVQPLLRLRRHVSSLECAQSWSLAAGSPVFFHSSLFIIRTTGARAAVPWLATRRARSSAFGRSAALAWVRACCAGRRDLDTADTRCFFVH